MYSVLSDYLLLNVIYNLLHSKGLISLRPFKNSLNLTEIEKIVHKIAKSKYSPIFEMNPILREIPFPTIDNLLG